MFVTSIFLQKVPEGEIVPHIEQSISSFSGRKSVIHHFECMIECRCLIDYVLMVKDACFTVRFEQNVEISKCFGFSQLKSLAVVHERLMERRKVFR